LLTKQLETLTETLSKLPTQLHVSQPSHSTILQVGGYSICGGAHESGCYIPTDDEILMQVDTQDFNMVRITTNSKDSGGLTQGTNSNKD